MRTKLVLGNWKMNGGLATNADRLNKLVDGLKKHNHLCNIGVCVPHLYVSQTQQLLDGSVVRWGLQDVSAHAEGAYTGETSALMASEFGATYALVGHSERRTYHLESDDTVAVKAVRCLEVGMTPVVCIGETLEVRERGETKRVVEQQLTAVLKRLPVNQAQGMVIAYEPVWAIGTGRSATVEQAQEVHGFLREVLEGWSPSLSAVSILYGGSVKASNAKELFCARDIDGGLIGGASLDASEFLAIVEAVSPAAAQTH